MIKNKLTVIITFLNEKEEVKNTIDSILENSDNNVEIIVINDASDDEYNYDKLFIDCNIKYVKNEVRLGVSMSRDLGVRLCMTPYFLLLDAHMRFYNNKWVARIIEELSKGENILLCTQTKVLKKKAGLVVVDRNYDAVITKGANVKLAYGNCLFEPRWIKSENKNMGNEPLPIACVLGAGYACSKEYWQYLKGLRGLIQFGNDEAYISMKVWLEGGKCLLLPDVILGHIYREEQPYFVDSFVRTYNRIFINETIISDDYIYSKNIALLKKDQYISKAFRVFYHNIEEIVFLRSYYRMIFVNNFSYFENINKDILIGYKNISKDLIHNISNHLLLKCSTNDNIGLLKGRMGIVIFLFHYSRHYNSTTFNRLTNCLFDDICNLINIEMSYSFDSGLSGIGWGIQYLLLHNFISGNSNEIFEDFDKGIMEIDPNCLADLSIDTGLCGIVLYLNIRLYSIMTLNMENPFKASYLKSMYLRIKELLGNNYIEINAINILIDYALFYEGKRMFRTPSIYDITFLDIPENYTINDYQLGLNGTANVGLKLILEPEQFELI